MKYLSLFISLFCVNYGNMLTIFQPCGSNMNNFIKFQKFDNLNDNLWRCYLNLQFYSNLIQPTVVQITYFEETTLVNTLNRIRFATLEGGMTSRGWGITALEGIKTYVFDVRPGANSKYPIIKSIVLNGYSVCNINGNFGTSVQVQAQTKKPEILPLNAPSNEPQCGQRKRNFLNLLLNSEEAEPSQWPWHVAIFMLDNKYKNPKYLCGGTLIARNVAITVAHCVTKRNSIVEARRMEAYVGVTDLTNINCTECQSSHVKEIIRHPHYSSKNNYADIAVLKLYYCLQLTDYVQPICVAGPGPDKSALFGYYGTVLGFGKTENDSLSNVLRYAEVQLQSDVTCYAFDRVHYSYLINEFNFCAGNGPDSNVAPCNGDSGGGLVIPYKLASGTVIWSIRGLVSTTRPLPGTKTCDPRAYTVYTDVTAYYHWILKVGGLNEAPVNSNILATYG